MPSIRPVVQLTGIDGNAFMVIGTCVKAARKAGMPAEDIAMIQKEMMSGDYNHLLATAIKYFDVDGQVEEGEVKEDAEEECEECGCVVDHAGICEDCEYNEEDEEG